VTAAITAAGERDLGMLRSIRTIPAQGATNKNCKANLHQKSIFVLAKAYQFTEKLNMTPAYRKYSDYATAALSANYVENVSL
jgi:hypothetical protein